MAEKLSVVMARKHLEAADIALLVIDATEGVSQLDAAIAGYAHESGRSMIIVVNKWDLVIERRAETGKAVESHAHARKQTPRRPRSLRRTPALRSEISKLRARRFHLGQHRQRHEKIFPLLEKVATERRKRIATSRNEPLHRSTSTSSAPPSPCAQRVKILYMTQASVAPPTFVLFTNRAVKLHFSYQRFLENQIREAFGFIGTPIWIKNRARN